MFFENNCVIGYTKLLCPFTSQTESEPTLTSSFPSFQALKHQIIIFSLFSISSESGATYLLFLILTATLLKKKKKVWWFSFYRSGNRGSGGLATCSNIEEKRQKLNLDLVQCHSEPSAPKMRLRPAFPGSAKPWSWTLRSRRRNF